ncbi:hypothetical protein OIU84_020330 [Salix udensis]|uniref:Uncharacterized protein n=1 Tax=Salix udensis TaxID=889485 RepID=A0AAD6KRY2_9ROSI|nr:hypothetical protein OIU84_020330 [Salix udensis]
MWIRYSHASQTAELTVTDTRDLKIKLEDDSGGLPFHIMRVNKAFKVPSFNCGCQISLGMSISRRSIQLQKRKMRSAADEGKSWSSCPNDVPAESFLHLYGDMVAAWSPRFILNEYISMNFLQRRGLIFVFFKSFTGVNSLRTAALKPAAVSS